MKNNFDDQFTRTIDRTTKTVLGTFAIAVFVWFLGVLLSLAAIVGVAYVAYHFISKLW